MRSVGSDWNKTLGYEDYLIICSFRLQYKSAVALKGIKITHEITALDLDLKTDLVTETSNHLITQYMGKSITFKSKTQFCSIFLANVLPKYQAAGASIGTKLSAI